MNPPTAAEALERATRAAAAAAYWLDNGAWFTLVTEAGTGYSSAGDLRLYRFGWDAPAIENAGGWFFHLRDLDSGAHRSLGLRPSGRDAESYEVGYEAGRIAIARLDDGIAARLEIALPADAPLELRRLTLENRSGRPRVIEVTSVLEVVLQHAAADRAHPGFSNLFVETERDEASGALLAHRRARGADESWPWLAHLLTGPGTLEVETDRARFLGRGGTPARPAALRPGARLSGTVGPVLDPVFATRRVVVLDTGAIATLDALLTIGADRGAALGRLARDAAPGRAQAILARAGDVSGGPAPHPGVAGPFEDVAPSRRPPARVPAPPMPPAVAAPSRDGEALAGWNGHGGFAADGGYVVRLPLEEHGLRLPPRPWTNVLANERFGCLVSETGAIATWGGNSRERRITPWSNDAVLDPYGEAFYLRDDASGAFASPLPGPARPQASWEARHGFGASTFRGAALGLDLETTVFVPRHDPLRVVRVTLANPGTTPRRISLFGWHRLVLGATPEESAAGLVLERDDETAALYARNETEGPHAKAVAFAAAVVGSRTPSVRRCGGDRARFLGAWGELEAPAALAEPALDPALARGADAGFALQASFEIAGGETATCSFLLGEGASRDEARALVARYADSAAVYRALAEVRDFWNEAVSAVRIETPDPALDRVVNGWLLYQTIVCRLWGRTAFYQSGGAFGFRDQLQDSTALLLVKPEWTRSQLLLHAAHQFVEGDVLHWWHPPDSRGLRTRFADDLLWLPYVASEYVRVTGDADVLDEVAPFVTAPPLDDGEDERFVAVEPSGESGDLYDHACRAIDRSLAVGRHGMPLFGSGDWNDGMNRVGREGRGESVWMAFFLHDVLRRFEPFAEERGDTERAARWRTHRDALRAALETEGWDGAWYRRGWYDDGAPLGSKDSDECRIDALVQAWSVLSGAAPPARTAAALDAMEEQLVSERDGLIRLLTPAFDRTPHDPGYIKGYVPGVRENGGQYTHAAVWVVRALAEAGRHDRAARLLSMLSPASHAATSESVARYQVEPYVVAADVYGEPPHVGRGGWTWYTGSAGWMFRVAVESILGLTMEFGDTLVLRPGLPSTWPGASVHWRAPSGLGSYAVSYRRAGGGADIVAARVDGAPVEIVGNEVRVPLSEGEHRVEIEVG